MLNVSFLKVVYLKSWCALIQWEKYIIWFSLGNFGILILCLIYTHGVILLSW